MRRAIGYLSEFSFSCRKATSESSTFREMVIPFGQAGYVVLFEMRDAATGSVLAVRHQREADYFN
jgi:hypothetical protein